MRVKIAVVTLLVFTTLTLVVSAYYLNAKTNDCLELQLAGSPPATLRVVNEDFASIQQIIFQTAALQQEWQLVTAFFAPASDWGGWATIVKADPRVETPALADKENPIPLPADAESTLYIMARNAWKNPHALRLVFLLDFQQTLVLQTDGRKSYHYDWAAIQPQADRAVAVRLPVLSPGLHQLSVLLIADPNELSEDGWYRLLQQKSFHEDRYDLWVGAESLPANVPAFESAEMGQAAASRMGGIEFIAQPEKERNEPLVSLALKPGQAFCVQLRFYNELSSVNAPYTEPLPLFLAIFWDDKLNQQMIYDLLKDAPDNLTLQLKLTAPLETGMHQLHAVVFQMPGYSQFNADGRERTGYPTANFSRRVLVTVAP